MSKGKELEKATGAFELADFETPLGSKELMPVVWSLEKHTVARMLALEGKSRAKISRETTVPEATIKKWQENEEFQEFMNSLVLKAAGVIDAKILSAKMKTLDARIAETEELDNWAQFTSKDSLELMSEIRKQTAKETESKNSPYLNVIERLAKLAAVPVTTTLIELNPNEK